MGPAGGRGWSRLRSTQLHVRDEQLRPGTPAVARERGRSGRSNGWAFLLPKEPVCTKTEQRRDQLPRLDSALVNM